MPGYDLPAHDKLQQKLLGSLAMRAFHPELSSVYVESLTAMPNVLAQRNKLK